MNLRKQELIGLSVEVTSAPDPGLIGLRGTVKDETRNMFTVETVRGEKRVPKKGASFRFEVRGGVEVQGDDLLFRPEDRIKRAR